MGSELLRRRIVFGSIILCFIVLVGRLVYLQGVQHDLWVARAKGGHEAKKTVTAERGSIRDRNGTILAMNADAPSIYARTADVRHPKAVAKLFRSDAEIRRVGKKLKSKSPFVWLDRHTDPAVVETIQKRSPEGIGIEMESARHYPKRALLGQMLGFANVDNAGLDGVEFYDDTALRGTDTRRVVRRDAHGHALFPADFQYPEMPRGDDVYLTIDEVIQYFSERELEKAVTETGAKGGIALVMNPKNGELLSMAVVPRFNPNNFKKTGAAHRRNRAIADTYEPGSTFKIVTASAALESGVVYPDEMIDCEEGTYRIANAGRAVLHDHDPVGRVPFRQVIARSSNIGTAKIAQRLGETRLASYIQAFGFGERLGIDLQGEAEGRVRETTKWSKRSLVSMAIGQEIGVTPLQMASALSVIANGGHLISPRIHREGPCATASCRAENNDAAPIRRVISEKTARQMTRILEEVVTSERGTGKLAAIPGYRVAGKTGTAQKIDPATGRYLTDRFVSSFIGFAPADDPAVVILVVVDEPQGLGWGGTVAAPVFSAIGAEALHYLRVLPNVTEERAAPTEIQTFPTVLLGEG
jgi:cell division protein FtsI (penicillin-binding protein 3)